MPIGLRKPYLQIGLGFAKTDNLMNSGNCCAQQAFPASVDVARLCDVMEIAIVVADADGHMTAINEQAERLFGYTKEELVGQSVELLVPARYEAGHKRVRAAFLAGPRAQRGAESFEMKALCKDGRELDVQIGLTISSSERGDVATAAIRDLTAIKRDQRDADEINERFQQLAENVNQVLWITDWKTKKQLYVNSAYERIFGRSCESIYTDRRSWLQLVHSEDRDRVSVAFRSAADAGEEVEAEYRIVRDDGEVRWIHDTAIPVFDDDGRVDRIVGIASDITDRKAAEAEVRDSDARFRQLAENIDEVFWLQDAASRALLYVSPAYEAIFGCSVASLMNDRSSWGQLVHPEDRLAVQDCFKDGALLGQRVDLEYRIIRADGEERWLHDRAVPIRDEDGRIVRVAGIASDITERKHGEQARKDLAAQLRHAQKMEAVGTLASGVAHDFNNVLTAIIGYLEIARGQTSEGMLDEALEGIGRAADQAVGITKALVMFGRKSSTTKVRLELGQVVEDSARLLRSMIPASIEIKTETVGSDGHLVEADATQIQQVIMNLSINARDAMPDGGELRLIVRQVDGGTALIVEDTGTGMSDEVQRRLGEPFFTTKTRGQGTGLGMAVVHGIVQDHHGRIDVTSKPGHGTRITITLPTCASGVASAQPGASPRGRVDGRGLTVLLAEDHVHVRKIAARALTAAGFTVLEAGTGVEAMRTFSAADDTIDLLVIDVDLPGRSGLSCLRPMRSQRAALPVVVITGNPDFALEQDLTGSIVLLRKPFTSDELLHATREARKIVQAVPAKAC